MSDLHPRDDHQTGRGERWESLAAAFAAYRYPIENRALVQALVDRLGVSHYEGIPSRTYIRAIRTNGGPLVHIHSGWTGGFVSEAEILDAVGDVDRGTDDGRTWWVTHPINSLRSSQGDLRRSEKREYGFCDVHFMALPASGVCPECAS